MAFSIDIKDSGRFYISRSLVDNLQQSTVLHHLGKTFQLAEGLRETFYLRSNLKKILESPSKHVHYWMYPHNSLVAVITLDLPDPVGVVTELSKPDIALFKAEVVIDSDREIIAVGTPEWKISVGCLECRLMRSET